MKRFFSGHPILLTFHKTTQDQDHWYIHPILKFVGFEQEHEQVQFVELDRYARTAIPKGSVVSANKTDDEIVDTGESEPLFRSVRRKYRTEGRK